MPTAEDRKMSRETISTWKKRTAWQPDAEAAECPICAVEFSLTVRRHHCRACGRCVCADCSKGKMVVAGYEDPERSCDDCREGAQPSAAARMCQARARTVALVWDSLCCAVTSIGASSASYCMRCRWLQMKQRPAS